ncbi:MAG: Stp1/IreP family PP2C-type Ser/Thr phosphatase [Candidatus Aminicenantes bacterium]|nr:Stp1/IreP family PP2C-type Ser/Thr phosphatase [Candidatus Aminicenantes bacterium]
MKITYYGKTDKGRVRKANEDYFANEKISDREYLFVVADGMGGHQAGDVASRLGTLSFIEAYKSLRNKNISIGSAVQQAIKDANAAILERASTDISKKGMGTTFSAIIFSGMKAHIVHVGDSRIYLIRDETIKKITTDHTFVEKMMEEGRLSEEEARNHPQKNILYMSLGARESFAPKMIDDFEVRNGDLFIICSDGLNNMVTDDLIMQYSASFQSPKVLVEELIKLANESGGTDNITIQAVLIGKSQDNKKTEPIRTTRKKSIVIAISVIMILVIFLILVSII